MEKRNALLALSGNFSRVWTILIPNEVMQALLRTLAQSSEVQRLPEVLVRDLLLGELNLL